MAWNDKLEFNIVDSIGILSTNEKSGWCKELNRVSWHNGPPKYDIRDWSPDHLKMGKGITLSDDELGNLKALLISI